MEKLISMTDFVLEESKIGMEVQSISAQHSNRASRFEKIVRYANFLKQPLTLGMFVPVMSNGIIPTEEEIKEAKSRVLFEGFELKGKYLWNKEKLFMISENYNESFENIKQIEWLLSNSMQEFYLSETAKNQLS